MKFVVAGGGTGGHIYPALAIARGLQDRFGAEVVYVGGTRGMENKIVPREGMEFHAIPLSGFRRSLSLSNLGVAWQAMLGVKRASSILKKVRPAAVIGTGGYVCGPVLLAAAMCRLPTLIHEQNALPGITNRFLGRFAGTVAVTFEDSARHFPADGRVHLTGLPVRKEVLLANREESRIRLGIPEKSRMILSFGGSQGARSINKAMTEIIRLFAGCPEVSVMHVTGPANYQDLRSSLLKGIDLDLSGNITVIPYLYDMPSALAAADLAVCRAGAATLAELAVVGLPAVLIPYPHAAENHQEYNARSLERKGAAVVVRDGDLTGRMLGSLLEDLFSDNDRLSAMARASGEMGKPGALDSILDCVQDLLDNKRGV